jgi:REP element-mobilizing transposase RayT
MNRPVFSPRKTKRLRKGRVSVNGARYFVTLCSEHRRVDLTSPEIEAGIVAVWRQQHQNKEIEMHCATVMPDHLHILFTLGHSLSISQTIRKFKSQTKGLLGGAAMKWQGNFFEHRLRPEVSLENFARYIFLNPYRKGLLPLDAKWSGWVLSRHYQPEFLDKLREGRYPHPEWLGITPTVVELIDSVLEENVDR